MTNLELNEACARKLGYHEDMPMSSPVGDPCGFLWIKGSDTSKHYTLPPYSTSIEAAWEIVEYIAKKLDPNGPLEETRHPDGRDRFMGYGFHLEHHSENSCEKWICTLPEIVCAPPYEEMNDHIQAEADTAPLAICLAFLKLDAVEAK